MFIDTQVIKFLKDILNSAYQSVKMKFLDHSNKLKGCTFISENLEKYLNEKIIEGSHKIDDVLETINSTYVFGYEIDT